MRATAKARHLAPVVGVYVGKVRYGIEIDDTVRRIAPDRVCSTPKYVTLKLELDWVIYIPLEFADDPCLASLARGHEAKHADADARAFGIARPAFQSALRTAIRQVTPSAGASRTDVMATLTAAIQAAVEHVLDDMTTVRERLDAEVDSPAELDRLKTSCDGRAAERAEGRDNFSINVDHESLAELPPGASAQPPTRRDAKPARSERESFRCASACADCSQLMIQTERRQRSRNAVRSQTGQ
jgi:hypothetical protein